MNYFRIERAADIGNGYVMLTLSHLYGSGPHINIPVIGSESDYPSGTTVEANFTVTA